MNLIFKNATIIDKNSPYNNKAVDIKVENGIITKIGNNIPAENGFETVEQDNLHISKGWFDSSVSLGEPGAVGGELIEVRRALVLATEAAEVVDAEVISEEDHEVRWGLLRGGRGEREQGT